MSAFVHYRIHVSIFTSCPGWSSAIDLCTYLHLVSSHRYVFSLSSFTLRWFLHLRIFYVLPFFLFWMIVCQSPFVCLSMFTTSLIFLFISTLISSLFPCSSVLLVLDDRLSISIRLSLYVHHISHFPLHQYADLFVVTTFFRSSCSVWSFVNLNSSVSLCSPHLSLSSSSVRWSLRCFHVLSFFLFWMIVSLVFVFASLIEYAIVNVIARRPATRQSAGDDNRQAPAATSCSGADPSVAARNRWKQVVKKSSAATEDTPLQQATYSATILTHCTLRLTFIRWYGYETIPHRYLFLPRCMQCRRGLAMRILSVRLSVTRVYCDKTVERSVQIYTPFERTFILVFCEEEWLVGGDPFYVKFWVNRPPLERNRRFSTNNRS